MTARAAAGSPLQLATPRSPRSRIAFPEETTQQKKERLYTEIEELDRQITGLMAQLEHKQREIDQLLPPFVPNQKVLNPAGGVMVVLAVERAFGEWVAKVQYDTGQRAVDMKETYVFAAVDLRPLEDVPVVERRK